ncbi:histone H1 [Acetobacteroides hydrogenigenes]|uniref:Histone H1-like protein Hc1 n=1 Tax=Acetobacteroides hydrogenigenes TaxID=979970 RepID=A0A4R2EHG3_9BACT|nr:histone H1 [Acetobacteroides hydrogenigenes]TCN67645.1 histone H1-like protein Hc1 [Acetobacteroides hydrogenigenes]
MQELLNQIKEQIALYSENAEAYSTKNSKAAGARARKATLELTKLFKEFRKLSIEDSKK